MAFIPLIRTIDIFATIFKQATPISDHPIMYLSYGSGTYIVNKYRCKDTIRMQISLNSSSLL
jgi:Na+/H+ antiporter NhaC